MRTTKALLLAAAIGAVSLGSAMAQVYSVNIVGYVNTTINHGFTMIQNPLNASPDNTVGSVIPTSPHALVIYKYNHVHGNYDIVSWDTDFLSWDDPTLTMNPGEGFFAYNPGAAFTLTFVGEVPTGTLTTPLYTGFNMVGSKVPQQGLVTTDLGYTPAPGGETIYQYNNTTGHYDVFNWDGDFQAWDVEPTVGVGTAFFAYRSAAGSWTRTFNVN